MSGIHIDVHDDTKAKYVFPVILEKLLKYKQFYQLKVTLEDNGLKKKTRHLKDIKFFDKFKRNVDL